jgi:hypothetical protein
VTARVVSTARWQQVAANNCSWSRKEKQACLPPLPPVIQRNGLSDHPQDEGRQQDSGQPAGCPGASSGRAGSRMRLHAGHMLLVCRRGDVAPRRGQDFPSPAVLTSRGSGNDTGHKMSFARQLLFDRSSRGPLPRSPFVVGGGCEGGHAKPDLLPSSSHPVWCCVRYLAACA